MQTETPATIVETTVRDHSNTLFASFELSKAKWLVTANSPGEEKFSQHIVAGGDGGSLLILLARLKAKAERHRGEGCGHSGGRTGRLLDSSPACPKRDREPCRRGGLDRGCPAPSARQDGCDRRREPVTDADGLGSRGAAGLLDGSAAKPGSGRSAAPVTGARHLAQGAYPAHQSDQRAAQRAGHSGI